MKTSGRPRVVVFLWAPFGFRADELAEALGARRESITLLYGPRYFAPIRYLALFFKTLNGGQASTETH